MNVRGFTKQFYGLIFILLWSGLVQASDWSLVWSDEFNYTGLPDHDQHDRSCVGRQ